jgi:hypothetical protein
MEMSEPDSDTKRLGPSHPTPRRPREDPPGQLSGDMWRHFLEEIVQFGEGKKRSPCRRCRVVLLTIKEVNPGTPATSA